MSFLKILFQQLYLKSYFASFYYHYISFPPHSLKPVEIHNSLTPCTVHVPYSPCIRRQPDPSIKSEFCVYDRSWLATASWDWRARLLWSSRWLCRLLDRQTGPVSRLEGLCFVLVIFEFCFSSVSRFVSGNFYNFLCFFQVYLNFCFTRSFHCLFFCLFIYVINSFIFFHSVNFQLFWFCFSYAFHFISFIHIFASLCIYFPFLIIFSRVFDGVGVLGIVLILLLSYLLYYLPFFIFFSFIFLVFCPSLCLCLGGVLLPGYCVGHIVFSFPISYLGIKTISFYVFICLLVLQAFFLSLFFLFLVLR